MRSVRQRDTAPELAVRRIIFALGFRFRVCPRGLPGRPDIANRRQGWCVQVHGCFWHGHERCPRATLPRANIEFWRAKVVYNRARDEHVAALLGSVGMRVLTVWECEVGDAPALRRRLLQFLRSERRIEHSRRDDYK